VSGSVRSGLPETGTPLCDGPASKARSRPGTGSWAALWGPMSPAAVSRGSKTVLFRNM
jgi:hypothetical protein